MPIINDASWSGEDQWLEVQRIQFIPLPGDEDELTVLYQSSNPLSADTTVDPGSGIATWNDIAVPSNITQVAISITDRDTTDQTIALGKPTVGDEITIREDNTNLFTVRLVAESVFNTTWFQYDVEFVASQGLITNNKNLDVTFRLFPRAIPAGDDRIQIRMAQEWPWIVFRTFDNATAIIPIARGVIPISDVQLITFKET